MRPKTTPRKVPLRQCAVCNAERTKRDLLRVVRSPEGEVSIDRTGRVSGRGVYLCTSGACLREGARGRQLARRLETDIPDRVRQELQALAESIA